jgi:hypothetical protein
VGIRGDLTTEERAALEGDGIPLDGLGRMAVSRGETGKHFYGRPT